MKFKNKVRLLSGRGAAREEFQSQKEAKRGLQAPGRQFSNCKHSQILKPTTSHWRSDPNPLSARNQFQIVSV
jgi:hypothetical protein